MNVNQSRKNEIAVEANTLSRAISNQQAVLLELAGVLEDGLCDERAEVRLKNAVAAGRAVMAELSLLVTSGRRAREALY
jgi:hypothetical protein